MVSFLLARGVDLDAKDVSSRTPLHLAAVRDRDIAEQLILKGADVNGKTQGVSTPLREAKTAPRPDIVELLLKHGARE